MILYTHKLDHIRYIDIHDLLGLVISVHCNLWSVKCYVEKIVDKMKDKGVRLWRIHKGPKSKGNQISFKINNELT